MSVQRRHIPDQIRVADTTDGRSVPDQLDWYNWAKSQQLCYQLLYFADPFINTIYQQLSFTKHAASTKIPHSLCEKTYLKPRMKCMILFTERIFIYKDVMGMGEKPRKRKGNERKNPRLVTLPSPLLRYGGWLFSRCPRTPKRSWTYSKWEGDVI